VSYQWNFAAGDSKSGMITRYRFKEPGRHAVVLTVTDNTTADNNADSDTVWVSVNDPVRPIISARPTVACPAERVSFSAGESKKINGKNVTGFWDFGDGQTAKGMQVDHQYSKSGRYTVTLMLDDGLALDNSKTDTSIIFAVNHQPAAVAGGDRVTCPGRELVFDATKSFDLDEANWSAEWDFGDGVKSTEKIIKHTFTKPGRYAVRLRVSDQSGSRCAVAEDVANVIVNAAPVAVAGPDRQAYCGGAHDAVLFDATGSSDGDGDGLVYEWDFADGTRASGAKVYHVFDKPGVYLVKLVVDDGRKTPCSRTTDEVRIQVVNH
jgi:PKD repeat protein